MKKGLLSIGALALVTTAGVALAQAPAAPAAGAPAAAAPAAAAPAAPAPAPPREYYVGNEGVGLPVAPPGPNNEGVTPPNNFVAMTNATMFGALYSVESCSYDEGRGVIVAPNRGVGQNVRANDAWISFINHDGSVHTPRWVGVQNAGAQRDNMVTPLILNEPFGSDIVNGVLYLADRDGGTPDPANPGQNLPATAAIAMFDIATGASVGRISLPDVPAFNDIEVMEDGTIYASVSGNMGKIWKVMPDGTASIFVDTGVGGLNSPNGVAFDPDGNIVVVNIGDAGVITYAPDGSVVRTEQSAQPGSDGLVIMPDGTKFVTSVTMGGISMIPPGGTATLIAENVPSAASMCYDSGANQLVIPMNANNGLAFVSLEGIWAP